jgi:hypothetical protein
MAMVSESALLCTTKSGEQFCTDSVDQRASSAGSSNWLKLTLEVACCSECIGSDRTAGREDPQKPRQRVHGRTGKAARGAGAVMADTVGGAKT